ncbi:MAG: hypothetical protein GY781_15700 [Gammaproteobacteria bacterium]|uniref:hypothetical protein n=1 Tax=Marisediminitalea aggregata TaxID=634436 RepID=UPI0012A255A2|nr:hypothetical protein [Marisediminitalea aggregata]MCP4273375.1 hypothetical protein [Gammaproteobacteria bacterium]MCP9478504.1 hypothetical protein [Marisediminitalea aggregata]BBO28973.1 hypothetical protein AltI4_33610 [Alteromonas sp. I4]|tara:strand:- start:1060 stop:1254 length:195 start_codon:yes stop_codon:yes gene_type:complete
MTLKASDSASPARRYILKNKEKRDEEESSFDALEKRYQALKKAHEGDAERASAMVERAYALVRE